MRNKAGAAALKPDAALLYRKRYESLVERSIEGIMVHRGKGLVFANDSVARMYGYRRASDMIGVRVETFIAPEELKRVKSYGPLRQAGKPAPEQYEFRGNHRTGKPLWVQARVAIVEWDGDKAWLVTLQDITERKQAEQDLRDSEERFRHLVEGSLEGINVVQDGELVFVNQAFAEIFGYRNPAQVLRHPLWEHYKAPGDRKRMAAYQKNRLQGRAAPSRYEFQGLRRDGKIIWLEAGVRRITWHGRHALQGTLIDITARKQVEADLVASKQLLDQILANIPVGLSLVDKDMNVAATNERFHDLLGFPKTMGRKPRPFTDYLRFNAERGEYGPGDVETLVAERLTIARKAKPHRFERVRPSGPALEISGNPLPGGGFISTYVDITDRRKAQEELLANQRLLQTVLDTLPHFLTVKDAKGHYQLVNKTFAAFWGRPPQDFLGKRPKELPFLPPSYAQVASGTDRPVLERGETFRDDAREVVLGNRVITQRVIKLPVRGDEGRIVGVVALMEDITEQRKADQELRANRRLLQMVFDVIPINLFVKDSESRFVMANRAQCAFYGLTPEQFIGLPTANMPGMTAGVLKRSVTEDKQVLDQGMVVPIEEYERVNAQGSMRWLRGLKLPLLDDGGKIVGVVGMAEDITAAKQAQQDLEDSRRLLRTVIDAIPVNVFVKDLNARFVLANRSQADLYAVTPEALIGKTATAMEGRVFEQLVQIDSWDRAVLTSGQPVEVPEMERTDRQGNPRVLRGIKLPLRDAQGRLIGLIGMTQDITEQREAAQALRDSQRLLRTIFDTIPHRLWVKDLESRYVMVNHAQARFFGLTPERMAGMHTSDLPGVTAAAKQEMVEQDRQVTHEGRLFDEPELPFPTINGELGWARVVKLALRSDTGEVIGSAGLAEDITDRKRVELEARDARRLLQTVFDAIPLRVSVRDAEDRYLMVNRRMAEDHQLPPEAFIGLSIWPGESPSTEDRALIESRRRIVRESGKALITPELPITLPGKDRRLVRSILVPLFDGQGMYQGTLGIGEDITERRKSEQALLQAQKLESLGVLAGGIAHDFNNLLVTIMGNASLALLKLPPDAAPLEELKQIEMAGQRAADLCRQMLSYAGKGRIEKQSVNVNQLVQEMTQLLRVSLPKGVAVNFHLMQDIPMTEADPTQLRQVIMNLVINAGEAIGERPGSIVIASGTLHADREYLAEAQSDPETPEGHYLFLEVSDTGIGMDPQTRARIFDPFFTTKFTGRGLGLASVLGIVRGHRGGLKVYSEVGKGTSFKVLLPIAMGRAPAARVAEESSAWSGGGTVLVIDDEQTIRSVAARMLSRLGFEVIEAADGAAAVEALRNLATPLTAALLDLTMPGLSGEETLRQLRRLDKRLPVILMSGYNEREVLDRFVGRELAGFLQKPFKLDDLRDKLRELFEQSATPGNSPLA